MDDPQTLTFSYDLIGFDPHPPLPNPYMKYSFYSYSISS